MRTGTVIGERFEIERFAGRGGMGAVYRALDRARKVPVAVKLLGAVGQGDQLRFERESQILAEIRHPGIVRYVAHGETNEGQPYLVMEWLDGEDLDERLSRGPLTAAEAVLLVRKAADALAAAHRLGVIHRDIKPSNVFLLGGALDRVSLVDFGVARSHVETARSVTRTGAIVGTPGYLAPEQARGSRRIDTRTDVFALGCVLFACLTGRAPYVGDDVLSLLAKVLMEDPPKVSALWPGVPRPLDELVQRMMAADPDRRPRDAAEVARALEALGELPETRRESLPPRPPALTTAEQRLFCVILMAGEDGDDGLELDLDTTADGTSGEPLPAVGSEAPTIRRDVEQETIAADTAAIESARTAPPMLRDVVRKYRGRLEVLAGGARLVMLEGGGVATDQAARAARCALAMRERMGDRAMALCTGRGSSTTRGVLGGDVVDRAARLLRVAVVRAKGAPSPLPVHLDDATLGLLGERFSIDRSEGAPLLRGERDTLDTARRLLGKPTPCVGRDRELGTLEAILDECIGEPVARAALLSGPPGAGKSRVRQELERRLVRREEKVAVWIGRGDAMSAGAPLDLVGQALRGAAGIAGSEPLEIRRDKLLALASHGRKGAEAHRVACFLGEIVGSPFPIESSLELAAARADAVLMGDQTRRAFEDVVAAACAEHPLLLVLEDLHWGDLPSVKFVDALLRNLGDRPLFVLATARTEVRQLFPALWEDRSLVEIRVGPLTPKASEKLVRHVLGDGVPRETVDRMVARSAGHALHLEELVRAVAEGGGDALPDTVVAMVEARIEALEPEARRLLRAGSLFGRTFWAHGAGALLGSAELAPEAREWLDELCQREWIARSASSRFPGEEELVFCQDIVREAAYAMLTDVDRALGHRLAGAWLGASGEDSALVLARHFELGGDTARARESFARAAEQSLEGDDFEAALEHAERAATLGAEGPALGRLRALMAETHVHLGAFESARARGAEAMELVPRDEAAWSRAAFAVAHAAGKLGDLAGLKEVVRELLALESGRGVIYASACSTAVVQLMIGGETALAGEVHARLEQVAAAAESTEPAIHGHLARAAGVRAAFGGDPGYTLVCLRASIAAFQAAGDLRAVCSHQKTQGWFAGECGALEEGERALRDAIAGASRMGLKNLVAHAQNDIGSPLIRLGKLEEAAALQEEAIVVFAAQGDRRLESCAHGYLSWALRLQGDVSGAEREARLGLATAPSAPLRVGAATFLACALLAAGRPWEALEAARTGLAALEECGVTEESVTSLYLVHAEALHALADVEGARRAIRTARADVLERAAKIKDSELQQQFLTRIAENARTFALCEAWLKEDARASG